MSPESPKPSSTLADPCPLSVTTKHCPLVLGILSSAIAIQLVVFELMVVWVNIMNPARKEFLVLLPTWYDVLNYVSLAATFVSCILLFKGGTLLMRRRPAALILHFAYSLVAIVLIAIGTVAFFAATSMIEPTNLSDFTRIGMDDCTLSNVLRGLGEILYPVFVLVWFTRDRVKRDVCQWASSLRTSA